MVLDHYSILEVSRRASPEVIHAAYRALAFQAKDDPKKLVTLNNSYGILSDYDKRGEYDKDLNKKSKKIIGNYRIVSEIAFGGFGTTYKGEHLLLKTPVCIKHAHNVSPQDEEIMFEEAKSIWDLRHWAIPAIREIVRLDDGSLAIVMSYVPGPTLHQVVEKNGPLDPEHVCWITERILNALKYLHFHGVIHGDVKPQNIIVQPDAHTVTLVDYGLSLVRPKKDTVNKGYPPYFASPEQEKGMPLLPESDLYSLAVTMIFALGGNPATRDVPSSTPDPLCKFIKKLLPFNPLSRPNWTTEDLSASLSDVREKSFGRRYSEMKPLKI